MNDQQVKQFLSIVKHMNLSRAAEELYISQPALSLALGRLERELGVSLFYRDGKKLIISPAGERLYDYFKSLKEAQDRLFHEATAILASETDQAITIAFDVSAMFFSSLYMEGALDSWNAININKIFANSSQVISMLKNGMAEFAVSCPPIEDEVLSNRTIFTEHYVLAVSSGHPLASKAMLQVEDLKNVKLTGLKRHHPPRQQIDNVCRKNHIDPIYARECNYEEYYRAITLYAGTDQFANLVPEEFFENTYGNGYIAIPFESDNMTRTTALSWLTERKLDLEYKDLVNDICRLLQEHRENHQAFSERYANLF